MRKSSRPLSSCIAILVVACSGHVDAPDGGSGAASVPSGGQPGGSSSGGGGSSSGGGGSSSGGGGSSSGGGAAAGGNSGGGAGGAVGATVTGGAGAGGGASLAADATLAPTEGNAVTGTAHFSASGAEVELSITLAGCPIGPHAVHLHANAACGDNANAAGGHWSPQGEGMGDVMCGADGVAQFSFKAPAGLWSIGGAAASDLLQHAVILHAASNSPAPGGRIACGIPIKAP